VEPEAAEPVEEEVPAVAAQDVQPPIPAPPPNLGPIPSPIVSKPGAIPNLSAGGGQRSARPGRERRMSRPRPIVAAPPPSLAAKPRPDANKPKPVETAQKPVMRLPAGGVPPAGTVVPPPAEVEPGFAEDDSPGRGKRGSALVGREERQRRRGQRAAERKTIRPGEEEDEDSLVVRNRIRSRNRARQLAQAEIQQRGPTILETPVTIRSFSEATGIRANDLQRRLMNMGYMVTINATLSEEQVEMLAMEMDVRVELKRPETAETRLEASLLQAKTEDNPEDLVSRPPVVTFMGHVDHGKTSLMDRIRSANVVATESGGITQHVGAYQVQLEDGAKVTFLDTPGHEAFTAMRARGANVTDIVVLVVAADDGVMPQTEEAISHAKAANVPIVVAMNKIDLPAANIDRLQQQLSNFGLIPERWGGDTIMVGTSAHTGAGISELLENLAVVAELKELKANPKRPASGMCIEASLSEGRGVQCTMLVMNGTLRAGDVVLCGNAFGRVRALHDEKNHPISEAGPATPVVLTGLDLVPEAGEQFVVIDDVSTAREIAGQRTSRLRTESQSPRQHVTLEKLFDTLKSQKLQELPLIIKADVRGSLEAIRKEISDFVHDEVRVRIIHEGIGGISESDVLLADASDAIIMGFRVVPDDRAQSLASDKGVEIRRYDIIYQVSDDIKKALEGLLTPDKKEIQLGRAVVQETFTISRVGTIAGCRVVQGNIERNARLRIIRDGTIIGNYPIDTLRRFKDDVREVREGLECGIKLAGFDDIKRDDVLEAFKIEEIKRTL
jgi:translation initiation factor IF-2